MVPQIQGALWLVVLVGVPCLLWLNRGLLSGLFTWKKQPPTPPATDGKAMYDALQTLRPLCEAEEVKAAWKTLALAALEYKA